MDKAPTLLLRLVFRDAGCFRPVRGVLSRACVITARNLRTTSYDARGPRAGAVIAVLGGRCVASTCSSQDGEIGFLEAEEDTRIDSLLGTPHVDAPISGMEEQLDAVKRKAQGE